MASPKTSTPPQSNSLRNGLDIFYQILILTNLVFMTCLDNVEFIPKSIKPDILGVPRAWYIKTFKDQFYINTPTYMEWYLVIQLCYLFPVSLWALWAIPKRRFKFRLSNGILAMLKVVYDRPPSCATQPVGLFYGDECGNNYLPGGHCRMEYGHGGGEVPGVSELWRVLGTG